MTNREKAVKRLVKTGWAAGEMAIVLNISKRKVLAICKYFRWKVEE